MCENRNQQTEKQKIFLVGIGMGTAVSLTGQAGEAIARCDYLIGARRMLDLLRETGNPQEPVESGTAKEREYAEAYVTEEILSRLKAPKKFTERTARLVAMYGKTACSTSTIPCAVSMR